MGTIYLGQKRFDDAETMLKRAIELSPSMPQPYINLASIDVHRKKADEALEYVARAETAGAERHWVHFVRAEALTLSGQFEAARREYELAAKFSEGLPLQHEIQNRLAVIRSQMGSVK
jgi:Flp pilus assembly protein TadD